MNNKGIISRYGKKQLVIFTILSILFLTVVWYFFWDNIRMIPYPPSTFTRQWETHFSRSDLQIRKIRSNEPGFLMKPTERFESYLDQTDGAILYEPSSKKFKVVSQDFWDTAEGEIKTCKKDISLSRPENNTYGWYPLISLRDSKSERVAVISATGPATPAIFSFPFGQATGRILGMRYLEIFYSRKVMAKGDVVRISREESLDLCWTPDENFIVIYNSYFTDFSVVDVNALEKNK